MGMNAHAGNTSNRIILEIRDNRLSRRTADGQFEQFDSVYGQLIGIKPRKFDKKDSNGQVIETREYVDFNFRDGNEFFTISGGLRSMPMERIVQKLAVIQNIANGLVYVYAWPADKTGLNGKPFTNIAVRFQGPNDAEPQKIETSAELPKFETQVISGQTFKITKPHYDAVDRLIAEINSRLGTQAAVAPDGEPVQEDMPEAISDPQPGFAPSQGGYAQPQQRPAYGAPQGGYPAPQGGQSPYGAQPAPYGGQPAYPQGGGYPGPQGGYPPYGAPAAGGYQGGGYNGGTR